MAKLFPLAALLAAALLSMPVCQATSEQEVMAELAKLRNVKPVNDRDAVAAINQRNDAVWKFLQAAKADAFPIVDRELRAAAAREPLDQFFILDSASFLVFNDAPGSLESGLVALAKIDPAAEIIQWNHWQLVRLAHSVSRKRDPRVLPHIDRLFLGSERGVEEFIAPSYIRVAAFGTAVLMYGANGPEAERYLAGLLVKPEYEKHWYRIAGMLTYLGSEDVVPEVKRYIEAKGDYQTLTAGTAVMMRVGGKAGRDAMLAIRTDHLEPKAAEYYRSIRAAVEARGWSQIKADVDKVPPEKRSQTPLAVLDSPRPRAELLAELKKQRVESMQRFHQRSLDTVLQVDEMINALQFRP